MRESSRPHPLTRHDNPAQTWATDPAFFFKKIRWGPYLGRPGELGGENMLEIKLRSHSTTSGIQGTCDFSEQRSNFREFTLRDHDSHNKHRPPPEEAQETPTPVTRARARGRRSWPPIYGSTPPALWWCASYQSRSQLKFPHIAVL